MIFNVETNGLDPPAFGNHSCWYLLHQISQPFLRGDDGTVFQSQPSEIFTLPSCQGLNLTLGGAEVMEEAHVWYGSYGFKYPPNGKIGQYLANAVFFFPHLVHPIVHYPICQNQLGIFFVIPVIGVTGNTPPFRGFGLWNPERWLICPVLRGVRLGCWKIEKEHTASLVLRLGPRFCSVFIFIFALSGTASVAVCGFWLPVWLPKAFVPFGLVLSQCGSCSFLVSLPQNDMLLFSFF